VVQLRQDIGDDQPHSRVVFHDQDHCQIGAATDHALSRAEWRRCHDLRRCSSCAAGACFIRMILIVPVNALSRGS
jgi:hypothetical protein